MAVSEAPAAEAAPYAEPAAAGAPPAESSPAEAPPAEAPAAEAADESEPEPGPPEQRVGEVELDNMRVDGPGFSGDIVYGLRKQMAERCFGDRSVSGRLEIEIDNTGHVVRIDTGFGAGGACVSGLIRRFMYQPYKRHYKITALLDYAPP